MNWLVHANDIVPVYIEKYVSVHTVVEVKQLV